MLNIKPNLNRNVNNLKLSKHWPLNKAFRLSTLTKISLQKISIMNHRFNRAH